jgi:flagellar L-ring protein precursor FlgH
MNRADLRVLLLLVPAFALAQSRGATASAGSLFVPYGAFADGARDLRASRIDDVLTIVVAENLSAVASGATQTSRKSSANSQITAAWGVLKSTSRLANPLNVSGDQQLAGTGTTSRNLTLSTTISARVVDVTSNGLLMVEGTRDIAVNSEKQTVTVRGLVRPADISTANTIPSVQVANLQVHVNGKGVVGDAIRRPNFLYRLLLGLLPF